MDTSIKLVEVKDVELRVAETPAGELVTAYCYDGRRWFWHDDTSRRKDLVPFVIDAVGSHVMVHPDDYLSDDEAFDLGLPLDDL